MTRWEKICKVRQMLKELGDYDTSIAGAVAEIYAEEKLGMKKADRGTAGYDGLINGRRVQVKGKECRKSRTDRQEYAAISNKNLERAKKDRAQDLLVVLLNKPKFKEGIETVGPVPICDVDYVLTPKERRYSIHNLKEAVGRVGAARQDGIQTNPKK